MLSKLPGGDSEVAEVFLRLRPLVSEDESCDELSAERDETRDRELNCWCGWPCCESSGLMWKLGLSAATVAADMSNRRLVSKGDSPVPRLS